MLSLRAQLAAAVAIIVPIGALFWALSARETFLEQRRILGEQAQVVARTLADALEPDTDPPATVARAVAGLSLSADAAVVISARDGRALWQSGPAGASDPSRVPGGGTPVTRADVDGVERIWAVARRDDGAVIVAIGQPTRIAWDRTRPIYRRNSRIPAVGVVLSVVLLGLIFTRAARGIRRLEGIAETLSRGELSLPPAAPMPSRELSHLQTTLIDMVGRIRELQHQVVRQERLTAIGVLVSGVAHEISNPLQSIIGSAQVLRARTDLPPDVLADLDVIQHESERASAIIRNLTRFTRQQPVGPAPVQLSDVVAWLGSLWERRLKAQSIALEVDDRATRPTLAVTSELQQVALNFLMNAEYALQRAGRPDPTLVLRTRDTPNGFVRLEVEDNGPGVPPGQEDSLFQPFFTTKPVGEGTGLGLSVSYGIIHSYGGCIGYERGPMGGALFYFEVPAAADAPS